MYIRFPIDIFTFSITDSLQAPMVKPSIQRPGHVAMTVEGNIQTYTLRDKVLQSPLKNAFDYRSLRATRSHAKACDY